MDDVQKALKERFSHLSPLIFHRSMEKAQTNGELFDFLDSVPTDYPVVWNDEERRWEHTEDLFQSENLGE